MSIGTLHESDRYAWLEQQTRLLKDGKLGELDIPHIIAELESEHRR